MAPFFGGGANSTVDIDDDSDDVPDQMTMAEVFHQTHRKLDRSVSEPHPAGVRSGGGGGLQNGSCSSPSSSSGSSRYKTELCRPYEENGSCKYGEKCQFAHGRQELRTVARHPKYKTDLCKTYHTTGLCPYGPRCHFIHNDEERYLNLLNRCLLQQQMQDSLLEKNHLARQQQVIAAALAAQKALLQQQQQSGSGGSSSSSSNRKPPGCSVRQMSTDAAMIQFPFVLQSDRTSSSVSDSSSSPTGSSPIPSPTSSLVAGDDLGAAGYGVSFKAPGQQQQQQVADPMDGLYQLLAKLNEQREQEKKQQEMDALIAFLVQKNSGVQLATTVSSGSATPLSPPFTASYSSAAALASPFSPPSIFSSGDYTGSRDNMTTCFSFAYPSAEL